MGLLDKVKNFFYDEEDVEDEYEEETHKEVKKENKRKYEPVKEDIVRKRENRLEKENEEVTERELFKADSTFNFPMDLDDTIYEKPSKTVSRLEKAQKEEPKKEVKVSTYKTSTRETTAYQKRTYPTEKITTTKDDKKFMPTPIISPIYGVLDKNYKKEDVALDSANDLNITKKLDYDSVMKRAMKRVDDKEDEENKSIFFNLDEQEADKDDEVKIIYNDVSTSDDMDNTNKDDTNNKTLVDEDNILSETKEQDLFNLIDNMYSSEDDEEDDE